MTLTEAAKKLHGDEWMNFIWRRAECIDRLNRDEFPWQGWDKEFPDLAAQRYNQRRALTLKARL